MNKFIKSSLFFLIIFIAILSLGILLPNNSPVRSIDYSLIKKHKLLNETKKEKIILTGGSNVIFGFNSKSISDNLNTPVINHAIHAGYGMKYILDDVEKFVNKGDILVFSPEYSHFLNKNYLGKEPLLFSLTAVPDNLKLMSIGQLMNISPFIPQFSLQKMKSFVYNILKKGNDRNTKSTYGEFAINLNGDNDTHWKKDKQEFKNYNFESNFNNKSIAFLVEFEKKIKSKDAKLIIIYPSLCKSMYSKNKATIDKIHSKLKNTPLSIIGYPTDYVYDDSLFFDSPYHLNGKGVKIRTKQISLILN